MSTSCTCQTYMDEIRFVLEEEPLTCAEMVRLLDLAIAKLVFSIQQNQAVTYLEIRNRRVQFSNPADMLEALRQQRNYYAACAAATDPNVSRRNRAKFVG